MKLRNPILAITGDTHGDERRFRNQKEKINKHLRKGDYLFICGDFGYLFNDTGKEQEFLEFLAKEVPYTICFCDGNHENFDMLNSYAVSIWNGGKVHIIKEDKNGIPKVIHLMRGQVYEIEGKKIFVFGGAYSFDNAMRIEGKSWWAQEMPDEVEKNEAIKNLETANWDVDYIITHTAPEETMAIFHREHSNEKPLNNFLEYIREKTKYFHWYMGHLHRDEDVWRNQTVLWFSVRNMDNNKVLE